MGLTQNTNLTSDTQDYAYIDTAFSADELIEKIGRSGWAGIDIEGSSLHSFEDNVSLIQLAIEEGNFIIDPLSGIDVKAILEPLSKTELILHGGDYDLRMLLNDYDFYPRAKFYDTMLAAELLGMEGIGLAAVVEQFYGEKMSKGGQRSDWTRRPLSDAQLKYAVKDVVFLKPLTDDMAAKLAELGRLDWWEESNQRLAERIAQDTDKTDKDPWRIKGAGKLIPGELVFLRSLWSWRRRLAKRLNKPPFKIMGNDKLISLSMWLHQNPRKNPKKFNSLPKMCRGKNYDRLLQYIEQARGVPRSQLPPHKVKKYKNWVEVDKSLLEQIQQRVRDKADRLGIKPQLILTRAKMEAVIRAMPKTRSEIASIADLMSWQENLIAEDLLEILASYKQTQ